MENRTIIDFNYKDQHINPFLKTKKEKSSWSSFFSFLNPSTSASVMDEIGELVLPAQLKAINPLTQENMNELKEKNIHALPGFISTNDDAFLESIQLTPKNVLVDDISNQYFIIKFNGNYMSYQDRLDTFAYDAIKLHSTVVAFNYRGVNYSQKPQNQSRPLVFRDLVVDGIAQVNRLLDNGVDSTKITLDGLSLGGAVATLVAEYFHKIGKPVYLWNDRSMDKLNRAAVGMVAPKIPGWLDLPVKTTMESAEWNADIAKAYNAIPAEYKGYMFVAKASQLSAGDGVIAHEASLHHGVKHDKNSKKTGHKLIAYTLMFDNRYKAHCASRSNLYSKEDVNISGQEIFENFVLSHRR